MSLYQFETIIIPQEKKSLLRFELMEPAKVKLRISNDQEEVRLLLNEAMHSGKHEVTFHFGELHAGNYAARLIVNTNNAIDITTTNIHIKPNTL